MKKQKIDPLDRKQQRSVSISTRDADHIESNYGDGSLTTALQLLVKGGKYEQLVAANIELTNHLKQLNGKK